MSFFLFLDQTIALAVYGLPIATQLSLLHQVIKIGSFTVKQSIELIGVCKKSLFSSPPAEIKLIEWKEDKEEECVVLSTIDTS